MAHVITEIENHHKSTEYVEKINRVMQEIYLIYRQIVHITVGLLENVYESMDEQMLWIVKWIMVANIILIT